MSTIIEFIGEILVEIIIQGGYNFIKKTYSSIKRLFVKK